MCCKDLWFLEVDKPSQAGRVALVRSSTHALEVCWTGTPTAQAYVLQVLSLVSIKLCYYM